MITTTSDIAAAPVADWALDKAQALFAQELNAADKPFDTILSAYRSAFARHIMQVSPTWHPIETAPKDGTKMLRPHVQWGAMAVRHKRADHTDEFTKGLNWMSADYSSLWPDEAFLPFWQPQPSAPPQIEGGEHGFRRISQPPGPSEGDGGRWPRG